MSTRRNKLLIIGPLPCEKYNCQWGGATILMKNFCDFLKSRSFPFRFVQTNKFVNPHTLLLRPVANRVYFMLNFMIAIASCEVVMFNFSDHGTVTMFPLLSRIAHLLGKKVVLRKFGGSFDIYLRDISQKRKTQVVKALSASDMIFFETKASIEHLKTLIGNSTKIHWFPNVRKASVHRKDPRQYSKRLVFMSHISDEKGVADMLEAFSLLPDEYQLDLYGAIKDDCYKDYDWQAHGVSYKGEVSSTEILSKLINYDILLLPTSYREGYPGIILEAISVGMPVVATYAGGIPEIIKNGHNGLLVEAHDINGMAEAILSFTPENYPTYCNNAYKSFHEKFESDETNQHILTLTTKLL